MKKETQLAIVREDRHLELEKMTSGIYILLSS
jgi:hypothetical protein